jgi:hypothetical protein
MGDRSPKSINKASKQHQVKANSEAQKKKAALDAKRIASKK